MISVLVIFVLVGLLAIFVGLIVFTQIKSRQIEKDFPPAGQFYDVGGTKIHARYIQTDKRSDRPTIIFVHGASGNLLDQSSAFEAKLKNEANLLFLDRPGHGWSERGADHNKYPDKQADVIAGLMKTLKIENAIIVGHSFGCAVTASFALNHPEKVLGLLFLAPVAYPWPGGIAWYYTLTSLPIIGWIFANSLSLPAGLARVAQGSQCVFLPNKMPDDYVKNTAPYMVLRPKTFRANAKDIASLFNYLKSTWPRYRNIQKPAIIISGNEDNVVFPYIHSSGLACHIKNSKLIELQNLGHKPDHITTDIAVAAVKKLAKIEDETDLQAMAKQKDQELADQRINCGAISAL